MPTGKPVDEDALHRFLFEKANNRGRLTFRLEDYAAEFDVRPDHFGRIIRRMLEDGRFTRIRSSSPEGIVLQIHDPDTWQEGASERAAKHLNKKASRFKRLGRDWDGVSR